MTMWEFCAFRIRLPDCPKLTIKWRNNSDVIICWHDVIVKSCFVSLVKFSYWSKFHVNIIAGYGVITIFFYKILTRNPEIRNIPVWIFPNVWRMGEVRDAKFGTNVCNEVLLNAAKCQGRRLGSEHVFNIVLKSNKNTWKSIFVETHEAQISDIAVAKKPSSPWKIFFFQKKFFQLIFEDMIFKTVCGVCLFVFFWINVSGRFRWV